MKIRVPPKNIFSSTSMYTVTDFLVYTDLLLRRKVGTPVEPTRSCSMWGASLWLNWDCRSGGAGNSGECC